MSIFKIADVRIFFGGVELMGVSDDFFDQRFFHRRMTRRHEVRARKQYNAWRRSVRGFDPVCHERCEHWRDLPDRVKGTWGGRLVRRGE